MIIRKASATTLALLIATAAAPLCGADGVTEEVIDSFIVGISTGSLDGMDLEWLDAANQSELGPIIFTTGIHCLDPSEEETYHRLQLQLDKQGVLSRVVTYLTLSPGHSKFQPPQRPSDLFRDQRVTQYHVWIEGPDHLHPGTVVAYKSRDPLPECDLSRANNSFKPTPLRGAA